MIDYKFYTAEVNKEELDDKLNDITSAGGIIQSIMPSKYNECAGLYKYASRELKTVLIVYKLQTEASLLKELDILKAQSNLIK